ncbi:unnamed protein product [Acidocella sp. C78]|uniref:DUF2125 domain-containing protein n=1 Tax=Acidocella sp. C78 TaxID=1671486 RepID=UPI00191BC6B7|nr:DUF2125 domain-containing protein [Acidocella sp. C78]CAG4907297.1 unnamed protein product [Acidocella sp. C78]
MRRLVRFLSLALVVVGIFWVGLWWYAESRLALAVDQMTTLLRSHGWTVAHGAVIRGTSPFRVEVLVSDLRLTPPVTNGPAPTLAIPALDMTVRPGTPFTLDLAPASTWRLALADGPSATLHFGSIAATERFDPASLLNGSDNPLRAGSFHATDLRIDSQNTNFTLLSIAAISVDDTRNPRAGTAETAFSLRESVSGLALSPIFTTLGDLPFGGKLGRLSLDLAVSGPAAELPAGLAGALAPQINRPARPLAGMTPADFMAIWQRTGPALHRWARAGGHGSLGVRLVVGPLDATGKGEFGFDSGTQPRGQMHLVADGFGAALGTISTHYPGLVGGISALTAAASPFLVRGPKGGQRLAVTFSLAHGALTANGTYLVTVPPLVWPDAPPPPAGAPKPKG